MDRAIQLEKKFTNESAPTENTIEIQSLQIIGMLNPKIMLCLSGSVEVTDPQDPHVFGLPDPDPLVRNMDLDRIRILPVSHTGVEGTVLKECLQNKILAKISFLRLMITCLR
jgi:hypothetical protein